MGCPQVSPRVAWPPPPEGTHEPPPGHPQFSAYILSLCTVPIATRLPEVTVHTAGAQNSLHPMCFTFSLCPCPQDAFWAEPPASTAPPPASWDTGTLAHFHCRCCQNASLRQGRVSLPDSEKPRRPPLPSCVPTPWHAPVRDEHIPAAFPSQGVHTRPNTIPSPAPCVMKRGSLKP